MTDINQRVQMKPVHCLAIVYETGEVYIDSSIKNEASLAGLLEAGAKASIKRVKVEESRKRSPSASALFHVWAQQLSGFTGYDVVPQKAALKIEFGYPILRQNAEMWEKLQLLFKGVDWWNLPFQVDLEKQENGKMKKPCLDKVDASKLIPCTSIMENKELKLMMDNIKDWARSQFGIELSNGKD